MNLDTKPSARFIRVLGIAILAGATATAIFDATSHDTAQRGASTSTLPTVSVTDTGAGSFNVISCANAGSCVAIGSSTGTDDVVLFDHGKWSSPRQLEEYAGEFVALSCPASKVCVALTDLAAATVFHDGRWSKLTTIDPNPGPPYPGMVNALSCTSIRDCVAVDGQGNSESYDGTAWTTPQEVDESYPLNDISCGATGHCIAVDGGGRALLLSGRHWSAPMSIDDTALTAISCATTRFCVAVDLLGRAMSYDGSTWSSPTRIDTLAHGPLAVSCWKVDRCVVVDSAGRVLLLTGTGWTSPFAPEPASGINTSLIDVSCPVDSGNFCAAVDSHGDALITTDAFGRRPT